MVEKRLRICMVINNFPPALGGAELYAQGLAERLVRMGHHVSVLTRYPDMEGCRAPGRELWKGVEIIRFKTGWARGFRFISFFLLVALWLLKNRGRIDAIHAFHVFSTGFMMCLIGKVLRKPVIVRDGEILSSVEAYYGSRLIRPLVRYCLKNSRTYVDNRDLLKLLGKFHPDAWLRFIQNPVDTTKFAPGTGQGLRKKLGLHGDFVVAYIGRLVSAKGIEFLLGAMPAILRKTKSIKLLIAGYGPEMEILERMAEDLKLDGKVVFTGRVRFEDVHRYYQSADVFVQPSVTEETPNTAIQAMSAGKPIVATNLVMSGVLENLHNALVIAPFSKGAIAGAVNRIRSDGRLRKRLGANARELAERDFSWQSHVPKVLRIYEESLL